MSRWLDSKRDWSFDFELQSKTRSTATLLNLGRCLYQLICRIWRMSRRTCTTRISEPSVSRKFHSRRYGNGGTYANCNYTDITSYYILYSTHTYILCIAWDYFCESVHIRSGPNMANIILHGSRISYDSNRSTFIIQVILQKLFVLTFQQTEKGFRAPVRTQYIRHGQASLAEGRRGK